MIPSSQYRRSPATQKLLVYKAVGAIRQPTFYRRPSSLLTAVQHKGKVAASQEGALRLQIMLKNTEAFLVGFTRYDGL